MIYVQHYNNNKEQKPKSRTEQFVSKELLLILMLEENTQTWPFKSNPN